IARSRALHAFPTRRSSDLQRLRFARQRLAWTQKQLAQASGLSQSAIGNYESGQRFTSRALLRLAHALGVSPEWLEFGHAPAAYRSEEHTSELQSRENLVCR